MTQLLTSFFDDDMLSVTYIKKESIMFIDKPDEKDMPSLEGTRFFLRDGELRYKCYNGRGSAKGAWVLCEECNKIAPSTNQRCAGRFCSLKCAYTGRLQEKHNRWKGGFSTDKKGYSRINLGRRRIPYHRYIMEEYLGRELFRWETLHHKDGNPRNNKVENLEIWITSKGIHPAGQRLTDLIQHIIKNYGVELQKELEREGIAIRHCLKCHCCKES